MRSASTLLDVSFLLHRFCIECRKILYSVVSFNRSSFATLVDFGDAIAPTRNTVALDAVGFIVLESYTGGGLFHHVVADELHPAAAGLFSAFVRKLCLL